jgi:hypothetical protein
LYEKNKRIEDEGEIEEIPDQKLLVSSKETTDILIIYLYN